MRELICKGRGFNCNLDCKQKDTCNQYVNNKIDFDKIKVQLLTDEIYKLKQDNELVMRGREEALDLRDKYNLSNELLKQGLLSGVSVKEMDYILNKVKNSDINIDYNLPLEVFLTYKDLEKRVNKI